MKQYVPAYTLPSENTPTLIYRTGFPLSLLDLSLMLTDQAPALLNPDRVKAEAKLRKIAEQKGYRVVKSRQRQHRDYPFWRYRVVDFNG